MLPPGRSNCQLEWSVSALQKGHWDRTLDRFTASWDEMYCRSSTVYFAPFAFQLVKGMDSLRSLRALPFHKMHSGAATMLRQSDNVLNIAHAICTRSDRALGFVNQHRVHWVHVFIKGLCRAANSCKIGILVRAFGVACNGLRTYARFTPPKKILVALWGAQKVFVACGTPIVSTLFDFSFSLGRHRGMHFSHFYFQ